MTSTPTDTRADEDRSPAMPPADRIRVLWLIKGLGAGGAERLVYFAAQARDRDSFDCEVAYLLPWKDALVDDLRRTGVAVHCLDGPKEWDLRWAFRLRRLIRARRIDVLHIHSPYVAGIARLAVRTIPRRHRPRVVYTEHLPWSGYRRMTRWLNAMTYPLDDAHVAVSDAVRSSIWRPLAGRVKILIHGVPLEGLRGAADRQQARAELGISSTEILVGTVANLRPQKRYPDLLDAAGIVVGAEGSVRFAAAGSGTTDPSAAPILARHAELGLGDRFRFLGFVEDTGRFLSACDIFVLASGYEGLPVSLMEALAAGLPVVVTDAPGIRGEVRDGEEAVLSPIGRPDLLADAILALARDPARRDRMSAAARVASDRFDIATAVRTMERLYRHLTRPERPAAIGSTRHDRKDRV